MYHKRSAHPHDTPLLKCTSYQNSRWKEVVLNKRYCLCLLSDGSEPSSGPSRTESTPLPKVEETEQNDTISRNNVITETNYYMWSFHLWEMTILAYCCQMLRQLARRQLQWPLRTRIFLEEFINAIDLCACFWDMVSMGMSCGVFPWFASRYFINTWWITVLGKAAVHPNRHLESWVRRKILFKEALFFLMLDFAGGKISYSVASLVWLSGFYDHHHAINVCKTSLKVTPFIGWFLEFLVHFISRLNGMCSDQWPLLGFPPYRAALNLLMVGLCRHYTGTFINPLLATTIMFDCQGQSLFNFFLVYWGGAVTGSIFALIVYLKILHPVFVHYFYRAPEGLDEYESLDESLDEYESLDESEI